MKPTRRQFLKGVKNVAVSTSPVGRVLNKAGSLLTKPVTRKVGVYSSDHIVGDHEFMSEYRMGVSDIPVDKKTGKYDPDFKSYQDIEYKKPQLKDPHLAFGDPDISKHQEKNPWDEKIGEIDVPDFDIKGSFEKPKVIGDWKSSYTNKEMRSYQLGDSDFGYKKFRPEQIKNIKSTLSKGRKLFGLYQEAQRVKSLVENTKGEPKQIENKAKKSKVQKRLEHSTQQRNSALTQKPKSKVEWSKYFSGASRLSGIGLGLEMASWISPGGKTGDATIDAWNKKNDKKKK